MIKRTIHGPFHNVIVTSVQSANNKNSDRSRCLFYPKRVLVFPLNDAVEEAHLNGFVSLHPIVAVAEGFDLFERLAAVL